MKKVAAFLIFALNLFADDFASLRMKQNIRIAMVGQGSLCEGKIESITADGLAIRVTTPSVECGKTGSLLILQRERVYQLTKTERPTPVRNVLKTATALAAAVAVWELPSSSSDIETRYILRTSVGFAAYAGWRLIPNGHETVLLLTCPDRFHCFSSPNAAQPDNPAKPAEK